MACFLRLCKLMDKELVLHVREDDSVFMPEGHLPDLIADAMYPDIRRVQRTFFSALSTGRLPAGPCRCRQTVR